MEPHLQRCLQDWIVIGISGVTCGGKTSAAVSLHRALSGSRLVHQDRYFFPDDDPRHVPSAVAGHHDYDVLSALDMPLMYRHLCDIITAPSDSPSKASEVPNSDALCLQALPTCAVPGKRVLIVEGFTILNYPPIYRLCHLCYYLDLEYAECARRRTARLYCPPDGPHYLRRVAWPRSRAALAALPAAVRRVPAAAAPAPAALVLRDLAPLGCAPTRPP